MRVAHARASGKLLRHLARARSSRPVGERSRVVAVSPLSEYTNIIITHMTPGKHRYPNPCSPLPRPLAAFAAPPPWAIFCGLTETALRMGRLSDEQYWFVAGFWDNDASEAEAGE